MSVPTQTTLDFSDCTNQGENTYTPAYKTSVRKERKETRLLDHFRWKIFFPAMPVWAANKVAASWKVPELKSGLNNLKLDILVTGIWSGGVSFLLPPFICLPLLLKGFFPLLSFKHQTVWEGNEFWSKKLCALVSGDKEQFFSQVHVVIGEECWGFFVCKVWI